MLVVVLLLLLLDLFLYQTLRWMILSVPLEYYDLLRFPPSTMLKTRKI
jgi:hypothetical protein